MYKKEVLCLYKKFLRVCRLFPIENCRIKMEQNLKGRYFFKIK